MKNENYKLTMFSCFVGIFIQAIVTNITAILFIPMMTLYNFSYAHLGILVAVNFTAQVASDIIFSGSIDKFGYRKLVLPTIAVAFVGLVMFGLSPFIWGDKYLFLGIIIATIIFAMSSGLLEVLMSPIVNDLPTEDKGAAMSLMHSFYAWGQVITIIVTTLFIFIFGAESWPIILFIWALVPIINFFMFLKAKFPTPISEEHRIGMRALIFKPFYMLAMAAIFFGAATEVTMNQWVSTFTEKALELPKVTGDLLGMCGFAVMLGLGRTLYGIYGKRLKMHNVLITGSVLGALCYIVVAISPINAICLIACGICGFASSLLWPGTLVISAERYPMAGAWLFAILAAAGDVGAGFGPWLTGIIVDKSLNSNVASKFAEFLNSSSEQASIRLGLLTAVIFPALAMVCHIVLKKMQQDK